MIEHLPAHIPWVFGLTTAATLLLFYRAVRKSIIVLLVLPSWLILQGALAISNVYNSDPGAVPPKIVLFGILPAIVAVVFPFLTREGRAFIDSLPPARLTFLHVVRIPVEVVLWWLFIQGAVPELMTFEGQNFDILAGITAPFVAYFGLAGEKTARKAVLAWNIICLGLLLNIVVLAFLSAPSPLQRMAFDQPNIAVLCFPFSWLPAFIVPVVLFAHLASIRQLMKRR